MRILILGAYGFIGSEISRALLQRGYDVAGVGRDVDTGRRLLPEVRWIKGDLNELTHPDNWVTVLDQIDGIINASGLLQSGDGGSIGRVQGDSIVALIQACERAGVRRFVQISAAGADPTAANEFMASKGRADAILGQSTLDHVILRPGLVIGRNCFGGTELVRMLAALPLVGLGPGFEAPLQTIAMRDVIEATLIALDRPAGTRLVVDLVAEHKYSLSEVIAAHRRWLGLALPPCRLSLPRPLVAAAARISDVLGRAGWRSPLRTNAISALRDGVEGDPAATAEFLGRRPLSLEKTLTLHPSGKQDRLFARLGLLLPIILAALAAMWALSGFGTLVNFGEAVQLLVDAGITERFARLAVVVGAVADIAVAAALVWRRTARAALASMVLLTSAYVVGGTILFPALWLDPLAPFAKTLPAALMAVVALWMVDRR